MWIVIALIAATATSLSTILSKLGLKNINSNFATMFKTAIVILFSFLLCIISGTIKDINKITSYNLIFLVLSGLATGCSWLCYSKALQGGNTTKVVSIDKASFILTSILFVIFFFDDTTNSGDILTIVMLVLSITIIFIGTILMIDKKDVNKMQDTTKKNKWLIYAILSSVFASLVALFVKMGLKDIPSSLGTFIRTIIVFIFSLIIVFIKKDYRNVKKISVVNYLFLMLAGLMTGVAWFGEYFVYNMPAVNPIAVNSIVKLSILLTVFLSFIMLKEKINKRNFLGLVFIALGTILIIIFSL